MENTIQNFRRELYNLGYCKNVVSNYPKYAQSLLDYTKETYSSVTDEHIRNYYSYLKEKPKRHGQGIISESHIYSQLLAIKIYFDYLVRMRCVKQNPYNLKIKQPNKKQRIVFTQEEIQTLYRNCQCIEEKMILHLCYGCGLRRTETENLNLKDINFEQKLLFVRKGKGKKRRVIPLTQTIVNDCKAYYNDTKSRRAKGLENYLITPKGLPMQGTYMYYLFKRLLKRTKATDHRAYCLHSLRHSIATHLLENEMSIEMVRDFLGHSELKTTQVYTRIDFLKTILHQ